VTSLGRPPRHQLSVSANHPRGLTYRQLIAGYWVGRQRLSIPEPDRRLTAAAHRQRSA
jgi:hypothetical protein